MSGPETSERDPKALVDWGDDCSPQVEGTLEWIHTRLYNAWHNSDRINALDEDELRTLGTLRLDAHKHLSVDEHAELRAIEKEIRRVNAGHGPDDVESTDDLDVAWAELLLDALEGNGAVTDAPDEGEN